VPHATGRTFTPRAADLGKRVTVEVIASRAGYLTANVPATTAVAVRPGILHSHKAPVISGRAVAGRTLRTTNGTWSLRPNSFRYQWYAGHTAIKDATRSTYTVSPSVAGERLHVVVTAVRAGYTPLPATSDRTKRAVLGRVTLARPTIRGHVVVGHTVTAHVAGLKPSSATARYRWYLGGEPIRGAHDASYAVTEADLGHRLRVVVTMRALNWTSRTRHSLAVSVRTRPRLHPHVSMLHGRVFLRLGVRAPGVDAVAGRAKVWLGDHRVGMFEVSDGRGSRLLAPMKRGTHTVTIVFRGDAEETVARKTVTVTVP
jgi:hypothetical protein